MNEGPRWLTCTSCGNVYRRDLTCWYCPKPEPAGDMIEPMIGSQPWGQYTMQAERKKERVAEA